jgi:hypothetical protein
LSSIHGTAPHRGAEIKGHKVAESQSRENGKLCRSQIPTFFLSAPIRGIGDIRSFFLASDYGLSRIMSTESI